MTHFVFFLVDPPPSRVVVGCDEFKIAGSWCNKPSISHQPVAVPSGPHHVPLRQGGLQGLQGGRAGLQGGQLGQYLAPALSGAIYGFPELPAAPQGGQLDQHLAPAPSGAIYGPPKLPAALQGGQPG